MGTLRILLILTAILVCFLLILPKHPKERLLENKILKIIVITCTGLIIGLSVILYYFRDTLWKEQDNTALITKKIQDQNKIKVLILSSYDLQNFDPSSIVTILNKQPKIESLEINELTAKNLVKLQYILEKNSFIKTLIINHADCEIIISIINSLSTNKNILSFILNRSKLTTKVIEQLIITLQNNQNITTIGLNYADLSDEEMPQILSLLTTNITNLSLQGNQFNTSSLEILAKALQQNKTLQTLTMSAGSPAESNKKLLIDAISNSKLNINFGN